MKGLILVYIAMLLSQRIFSTIFSDYQYISVFTQQVFGIFLPTLAYYIFLDKEKYISKKDLKMKWIHIPFVVISGLSVQMLGVILNMPFAKIFNHFGFKAPAQMEVPQGAEIILYIFLICVLPAIFEEVLFRKLTFSVFSKFNKKMAVMLTALIFAICHFNIYAFVALFLTGILMSYIIYKGFSLIYVIIFHFSLNFSGAMIEIFTRSERFSEIFNNHFHLFTFISAVIIALFISFLSFKEEK